MPARLTVHFPSRPARVALMPDGKPLIAGRDPECDLVLDDDRVSRHHARILYAGSSWMLTDLASKNGTLIDGAVIAPAAGWVALKERSWLSFGGLVARFEVLSADALERSRDEHLRRLTNSLELRRGLDPALGLPALLPRVVRSMLELSGGERGFLLLANPEGELEVAARYGRFGDDLAANEFGGSLGCVRGVLASGNRVVASDAPIDAELGEHASIVDGGIRALLCLPVKALDRLIGVLYADSRVPGAAFTELDLELLEALAAQAGLAIAVARLDSDLKCLARRIAGEAGAEPELTARLAGDVAAVLERSLPVVQQPTRDGDGWARALAEGRPRSGTRS